MNEEKVEAQRRFYEKCGELLGLPVCFVEPHYRLTRWNNRNPGNGRMVGYGVIKRYSAGLIQVCFYAPSSINRTFTSEEAVYAALRDVHPITLRPASEQVSAS